MGKMMFVDLSLCTACRGCQVACKQWKDLPGELTKNRGSHQNPEDLSFTTLKLVRFIEQEKEKGGLDWHFFPDACRHCYEPPCMGQASLDDDDAVYCDAATGAVVFTDKIVNTDGESVRSACPYDIPRQEEGGNGLSKCDFCIDRITNGMKPACVSTCPTGCMVFGDEEEVLPLAEKRLEEVKKKYPNAILGDPDSVRVVYLFLTDPTVYHENAVASLDVQPFSRKEFFATLRGKKKSIG